MKRALVMLAVDHNPLRFQTGGSYASEKLDGMRCLWLPETQGMKFTDVVFANREKDTREYTCSGLWSRKGKVIAAPDWFTAQLPPFPVDGELWLGRDKFQKTISITRKHTPDEEEWKQIKYRLFDLPSYQMVYQCGEINDGYNKFVPGCPPELTRSPYFTPRRFTDVYRMLDGLQNYNVERLDQVVLPNSTKDAEKHVEEWMAEIVALKGEGLMLRRPHSIWTPKRHEDLAKVKKLDTGEAKILGYVFGTGKLLGKFGAVKVEYKDKFFEIGGGFTDVERTLILEYQGMAARSPGGSTAISVSERFPCGSTITFEYNGVSDAGIPRFPRYRRVQA
jgi:DNA ligase-1